MTHCFPGRLLVPIALGAALCLGQAASAQDVLSPSRPSGAVPEITAGTSCTVNKAAFIVAGDPSDGDSFVETTSSSFVLMPRMARKITTTAPGCVIVDFTGEMTAEAGNRPFLQVLAVGHGAAAPGFATTGYPSSTGNFESRSMRFVFRRLPAGDHTLRLRWRSETGARVFTRARMMTVHYR